MIKKIKWNLVPDQISIGISMSNNGICEAILTYPANKFYASLDGSIVELLLKVLPVKTKVPPIVHQCAAASCHHYIWFFSSCSEVNLNCKHRGNSHWPSLTFCKHQILISTLLNHWNLSFQTQSGSITRFLPSIGLQVLSLPASVRLPVRPSLTKFVRAITHHPFKLRSPNLAIGVK